MTLFSTGAVFALAKRSRPLSRIRVRFIAWRSPGDSEARRHAISAM